MNTTPSIAPAFVTIGVAYAWAKPPRNALAVPSDWARHWAGTFPLRSADVLDRKAALDSIAADNRAAIDRAQDGLPLAWWLAFRVRSIRPDSQLELDFGRTATFHIRTELQLVRPTKAEVRRLTK